MNHLKTKYNLIWLVCFYINSGLAIADQCPSIEFIKERKISRAYDWSIDERRSIDDLLSVNKLYSVRIKNKGEFVACYYSASKTTLRLDGAANKEDCLINKTSGLWEISESGELVCKEDDLNLCLYEIVCEKSEPE